MLAVERSLSPRVTRECYCVSKAPGTYHIFRIVLKKQEVPSGLPLIYGLCHVPCVGGVCISGSHADFQYTYCLLCASPQSHPPICSTLVPTANGT